MQLLECAVSSLLKLKFSYCIGEIHIVMSVLARSFSSPMEFFFQYFNKYWYAHADYFIIVFIITSLHWSEAPIKNQLLGRGESNAGEIKAPKRTWCRAEDTNVESGTFTSSDSDGEVA